MLCDLALLYMHGKTPVCYTLHIAPLLPLTLYLLRLQAATPLPFAPLRALFITAVALHISVHAAFALRSHTRW